MERIPYHRTYEIIGWAFEADLHCDDCTVSSLGGDPHKDSELIDREGNHLHPIFLGDVQGELHCGDCGKSLTDL